MGGGKLELDWGKFIGLDRCKVKNGEHIGVGK